MFILLTKHLQISGRTDTDWKMFSYLDSAQTALERIKRASDNLEKVSVECMAPPLGPKLVQSVILKVEEVQ